MMTDYTRSLVQCSIIVLIIFSSGAHISGGGGKTQISGRAIPTVGTTTTTPSTTRNETNTFEDDHVFSDVELERLCPPGNTEVLKSIPRQIRCRTGNTDFWYLRCKCHYSKQFPCPICPDESTQNPLLAQIPTLPSTSALFNGRTLSRLLIGSSGANGTELIYQIPLGDDGNDTVKELGTANKFNVYNSAGGIVNLYFYNTGQQQLISPPVVNSSSGTGSGPINGRKLGK